MVADNINRKRLELISTRLGKSRDRYNDAVRIYNESIESLDDIIGEGTDAIALKEAQRELDSAIDAIGRVAELVALRKPDPEGSRFSKALVIAYQSLDDLFSATGSISLALEVRKLKIEARSVKNPDRGRARKLADWLLKAFYTVIKFVTDIRVGVTKGRYILSDYVFGKDDIHAVDPVIQPTQDFGDKKVKVPGEHSMPSDDVSREDDIHAVDPIIHPKQDFEDKIEILSSFLQILHSKKNITATPESIQKASEISNVVLELIKRLKSDKIPAGHAISIGNFQFHGNYYNTKESCKQAMLHVVNTYCYIIQESVKKSDEFSSLNKLISAFDSVQTPCIEGNLTGLESYIMWSQGIVLPKFHEAFFQGVDTVIKEIGKDKFLSVLKDDIEKNTFYGTRQLFLTAEILPLNCEPDSTYAPNGKLDVEEILRFLTNFNDSILEEITKSKNELK